MNDKRNLKKIETDLINRKIELEQKLTEMSKEQFSDGQVQDPGDQALTATMESLRMSLQDAEMEEYRGISKALERIKEGSYGTCSDCGNPISEKRLQSFPGTMRCLACQENFEEKPGYETSHSL
jgi:RNA polymerase-binding protein DksA